MIPRCTVGLFLLLASVALGGCRDSKLAAPSEPAAAATAAATGAATAAAPESAKTLSAARQVEFHNHDDWQFISFAECALFDLPALKQDTPETEKAARREFMATHKIDGPMWCNDDENPAFGMTTGPNTVFLLVDNTAWETFTASDILQALDAPQARKGAGAESKLDTPLTFIFRTIYGVEGIAQIKAQQDGLGRSAIIKSKIIQTESATTQ